MVFDTNSVINHVRRETELPARAIISVVVAGELEAFALKSSWGQRKVAVIRSMFERFGVFEIGANLIPSYAQLDAYSQGKLTTQPLPPGMSARNMGKNDLWIAATALYFDLELHTADRDFDHLRALGLRVVNG